LWQLWLEIIGPHESTSHGDIVLDTTNPRRFALASRELEEGQTQIAIVDGDESSMIFSVKGPDKTHTFVYRRRT
jgi:hypothetical protein